MHEFFKSRPKPKAQVNETFAQNVEDNQEEEGEVEVEKKNLSHSHYYDVYLRHYCLVEGDYDHIYLCQ